MSRMTENDCKSRVSFSVKESRGVPLEDRVFWVGVGVSRRLGGLCAEEVKRC